MPTPWRLFGSGITAAQGWVLLLLFLPIQEKQKKKRFPNYVLSLLKATAVRFTVRRFKIPIGVYATKELYLPLNIGNIVQNYPIYLENAAEQSLFLRLPGRRIIFYISMLHTKSELNTTKKKIIY